MANDSQTSSVKRGPRNWSRRAKIMSGVLGALMAGGVAFGVTNWGVGLGAGSSGEAQSGTVSNITVTAIASPAATNLLYPGGNGDVVVSITNPNPVAVTVTAVDLPTNLTYAAGYTTSNVGGAANSCTAAVSLVGWNYATATSGTVHTLTTPIVVGASNSASPLVITLTNDATMGATSPALCESTWFSMPSLTG